VRQYLPRRVEVAVNPFANTVYVTNEGDGTVSVISGRTRTVTAIIPVGNVPVGVAVNPVTRTAYVTNRTDSTVSVIGTGSVLGPGQGGKANPQP